METNEKSNMMVETYLVTYICSQNLEQLKLFKFSIMMYYENLNEAPRHDGKVCSGRTLSSLKIVKEGGLQ